MGQVYQATDTKLNRQVALKILPEAFATDPDRLARFQREAQVLASLNHPNIAAIHGLEDSEGTKALVLELVEGPTLADRIAQGPIPVDEALPIAKQITEALEAAHEAGVIHRDLKPANIKVREDGTVKVLDFGLAKALDTTPRGDPSQSPTLTAAATQMGVIMGTAAYMSPEQAAGKQTDKRTDIWSFGVVLFEMLTGRLLFTGETVSDVLGGVLRLEPDWEALPHETPPSVERLLHRCLRKERKGRLRDIGDALVDLEEGRSRRASEPEGAPAISGRRVPGLGGYGLTAVATAGLVGAVLWLLPGRPPQDVVASPIATRTAITLPEGQRQDRLRLAPLAISPDGTLLAYVARDSSGTHLFLRQMNSFETRKIERTENAAAPFFSRDGQWVGFFATGQLKKVSVDGGAPQTIARAHFGYGGSWDADDTITFNPNIGSGLWRVSADGGVPVRLSDPDHGAGYAHVWPQALPGGRHVLFSQWGGTPTSSGLRVLDVSSGRSADGSTRGQGYIYVPSGHIVYSRGGALRATPFDLDTLSATGSATAVIDGVRFYGMQSARPFVAISDTGTVVYAANTVSEAVVMWADRGGSTTPILRESRVVANLRLSPVA